MELCLNNKLIKKWRKTIRKEAEEATKRGEVFNPSTSLEVRFLRNFTEEFLDVKSYLKTQCSQYLFFPLKLVAKLTYYVFIALLGA